MNAVQLDFAPVASLIEIDLETANSCLVDWDHKMGPLLRGNQSGRHFALLHNNVPVAIACQSTLIRDAVGGDHGLPLSRDNSCELSRLCAVRPHLCRVMLRLWREFIFPTLGYQYCISYQDADIHSGNTYRFDGWTRIALSRSGTDSRSGRKGRNKWVWLWERRS